MDHLTPLRAVEHAMARACCRASARPARRLTAVLPRAAAAGADDLESTGTTRWQKGDRCAAERTKMQYRLRGTCIAAGARVPCAACPVRNQARSLQLPGNARPEARWNFRDRSRGRRRVADIAAVLAPRDRAAGACVRPRTSDIAARSNLP